MKKEVQYEIPREDHLDDYIKLTPEQILIWLEEANRFYRKFTSPEKSDRWKEFKNKQFILSSKPPSKPSSRRTRRT